MLLQDHAELIRAPLFKNEADGRHPIRIASISDFPCCGYLPVPRREIKLTESLTEAQRFCLKPYDVLLTIVGSVGHLSVVPDSASDNWVPATNMVVLRPKDASGASSIALYLYFKSETGRSALDSLVHGKTIRLVSKKALGRLTVPSFSQELLQTAGELFDQEVNLYKGYLSERDKLLAEISRLFSRQRS